MQLSNQTKRPKNRMKSTYITLHWDQITSKKIQKKLVVVAERNLLWTSKRALGTPGIETFSFSILTQHNVLDKSISIVNMGNNLQDLL